MENKKILKIAGIVVLGGIIIGFSINPIRKMIANYRGENSKKNKETTSIKSEEDIKKDAQLLEKAKQETDIAKLNQKQADDLILQYSKMVKDSNEKFGGMTYQTSNESNKLLDKLYKGGYTYKKVSDYVYKAVKK
jgi:DNA-binding transcriptional MerR regulator